MQCNRCNSWLLTTDFAIVYSNNSLIMKQYLNASEVAKLLRVDRATVSRWLKKGHIPKAIRIEGKQQWRIPISSYEELVRRQQHESH
ncbi:MAG: helix-turn-helix domain-containing protein [Ktedonobacteraceae bacterium]|nr:helix-turn-helix domain-containing protein [Ktedonobacteraceae bacterium]